MKDHEVGPSALSVVPSSAAGLGDHEQEIASAYFGGKLPELATTEEQLSVAPATELSPVDQFIYRYPLVLFFLAWTSGIGLAATGLLEAFSYGLLAIVSVGIVLFLTFRRIGSSRLLRGGFAIIATVTTAAWHAAAFQPPLYDSLSTLATRQSQPVALQGIIVEAAVWSPNPYHRPTVPNSEPWSTRWRVQWDSVREDQRWRPIHCLSKLATTGRITNLLPGDRIEVYGSFAAISKPTNPGMSDFSKRARLEGLFINVRTDDATQIKLLESTHQWPLQRLRGAAVRFVDAALNRYVSFEQAPLAAALVFGQREQVDWESQQQLMATGTLHMLAISGMHVEMIAAAILIVCQIFSFRRGIVAIAVVAICAAYAGLAGANPPVLRALILIVAFTAARYFGVNSRLFNLLALAALVLLWLNAGNLTNVGVQLSFLAVATIGIFNRDNVPLRRSALQSLLEESLPAWRRWGLVLWRHLLAGLRISFWVWLLTTPLIWHHFHVVSLVSIPLNVVLSIPLMVGLLAGLITPLVSWLPGVGLVTGALAGFCLAIIEWLVDLTYAIPLGHVWLPSPPLWWSIIFYVGALVWLLVGRGTRQSSLAVVLVVWLLIGLALFAFGPRGFLGWHANRTVPKNAELRCTFVDVGHGTSVIIEMPDGRVWLYDAGHMGLSERSHEVIASPLWSLQTARIDTLVISHADSDHYNATPGLIQRFPIGRIVSTKRFWESTSREAQLAHQAVLNSGNAREFWHSQSEVVFDDERVQVDVLHPPPAFRGETDNADSLCLQIEYAGVRVLLPGDIEGSGMLTLCESPPRRCQIMMAPHHGSLSHDVSELMEWCDPKIVVISGNERAIRPNVLQRFVAAEKLGITFADGAVQIRVTSEGTVESYHWDKDRWLPLEN